MIVGMTAAVRTHAMSSPSPSPSSLWAWANSSSPSLRHLPLFPQQLHRPVTLETVCFLCHNAWVYASIMTHAGCIFMTPTPWGAFMRGRWIVQEQCIQLLASWAVARFNWKSSSPPRDWPFKEGCSMLLHLDLHLFNLWYVLGRAGFIGRVIEYNPNRFSEGQVRQMWSGLLVLNMKMGSLPETGLFRAGMYNVWHWILVSAYRGVERLV